MFATEEDENSKSLKPTTFDIARLEDLEIGQKVEGEIGNWQVFRYKNDYTLICNKIKTPRIFKKLKDLINFLNK